MSRRRIQCHRDAGAQVAFVHGGPAKEAARGSSSTGSAMCLASAIPGWRITGPSAWDDRGGRAGESQGLGARSGVCASRTASAPRRAAMLRQLPGVFLVQGASRVHSRVTATASPADRPDFLAHSFVRGPHHKAPYTAGLHWRECGSVDPLLLEASCCSCLRQSCDARIRIEPPPSPRSGPQQPPPTSSEPDEPPVYEEQWS